MKIPIALQLAVPAAFLGLALAPLTVRAGQTPPAPKPVDFQAQLMPIVKEKCLSCHGETKQSARLDLRTPESWKKGGGSGPLYKPGDAAKSLLIKKLIHADPGQRMPRKADPLTPAQITLFKDWITLGAKFGGESSTPASLSFESDVKPILMSSCAGCHGSGRPAGGYSVTSYQAVMREVYPKDAANSVLVRRLKGMDGRQQMPLNASPLSDAAINTVETWIQQGAAK